MNTDVYNYWAMQAERSNVVVEERADDDGTAGFYYYDRNRTLAFHWTGDVMKPVQVQHGGDHEPVAFEFSYMRYKPLWVVAGTKTAALAFKFACDNWVERVEKAAREEGRL